jgi:choline dehydrogenase-like flavoprotein
MKFTITFKRYTSSFLTFKIVSASRAYLRPAMKRKNLTVKTRAFVTKIHFEGKKATGFTLHCRT